MYHPTTNFYNATNGHGQLRNIACQYNVSLKRQCRELGGLLTIKFRQQVYSLNCDKKVSRYLFHKWQDTFENTVNSGLIDRLISRSLNIKNLKRKATAIEKMIQEQLKLRGQRFSYMEKVFTIPQTRLNLLYLYKIYKYGFCVPFLNNRTLHRQRSDYFKYLKHLRNRYLRSKNHECTETQILDRSFNVYDMKKYLIRRIIKEGVKLKACSKMIKDNLLIDGNNINNPAQSYTTAYTSLLPSIDLSRIGDERKSRGTISDIEDSIRLLLDNNHGQASQLCSAEISIKKLNRARAEFKFLNKNHLKTSIITRSKSIHPTIKKNNNVKIFIQDHNSKENDLKPTETSQIYVGSTKNNTKCPSKDGFGFDIHQYLVPLNTNRVNCQIDLRKKKNKVVNSGFISEQKPCSLPPIQNCSPYTKKKLPRCTITKGDRINTRLNFHMDQTNNVQSLCLVPEIHKETAANIKRAIVFEKHRQTNLRKTLRITSFNAMYAITFDRNPTIAIEKVKSPFIRTNKYL